MSDGLETSGGILSELIFHLIGLFKNDQRLHKLRLLLDEGPIVSLPPRQKLGGRDGLCTTNLFFPINSAAKPPNFSGG